MKRDQNAKIYKLFSGTNDGRSSLEGTSITNVSLVAPLLKKIRTHCKNLKHSIENSNYCKS